MKREWALQQGAPVAAWQGALCGSISGAFAAVSSVTQLVCRILFKLSVKRTMLFLTYCTV